MLNPTYRELINVESHICLFFQTGISTTQRWKVFKMSNFIDVNSPEHFKDLLSADLKRVSCLNFWAPWAEPCEAFTATIKELAGKYPQVLFLNVSLLLGEWWEWLEMSLRPVLSDKIEAEDMADISESFNIDSVPTVLVLRVRTHLSPLLFPLSSRTLS
jgi:thiol-disulfide isomerase/thioredoxin